MLKTFIVGAAGYPLLEVLFRGRTHFSMAIAGGISLCLMRKINRKSWSFPAKAFLSGAGITIVELLCGMIWNRKYAVWDYRRVPLNFRGQICLPYTLLWCGLSAGILVLDNCIKRRLARL